MTAPQAAGSEPAPSTQIRVSVVIPFLNGERFLGDAIESVIAQTYTCWELLLVDDGSSDSSPMIARDYERRYLDRIRYLAHPQCLNRGLSESRNLGIRHARGEYIAFLDADDLWLAEKLERHVPLLDAHPDAGMLYGNTLYWNSWQTSDGTGDHLPDLGVPTPAIIDGGELLLKQLQGSAPSPCTCSVLARRTVVDRVNGFEDDFRGMHDDLVFYAKMLTAAPAYVADGWFERYRQHADSMCSNSAKNGTGQITQLRYLDWLDGYLTEMGLSGSALTNTVADARLQYRHPEIHGWLGRARRGVRRLKGAVRRTLRSSADMVTRRPPPIGRVRFGDLRRTEPINRHWGWERGQPVDRYYIEEFLARHSDDVRGKVLEVGDDAYTRRFGADRVGHRDILHVHAGNPIATVIADLADADHLPADTWDCIILTQTIHLVYDLRKAMCTLHRILCPGGVLLVTAPGISQTTDEAWRDTWYWALTTPSLRRLATESFPGGDVEVRSYGNVLTAVAFLHGLAREELRMNELATHDPDFPVLVTLRARKAVE